MYVEEMKTHVLLEKESCFSELVFELNLLKNSTRRHVCRHVISPLQKHEMKDTRVVPEIRDVYETCETCVLGVNSN